ncbi:MAG: hypothetical protein ACM3QY_03240 [Candidatus Levyibacteriota bacterium]
MDAVRFDLKWRYWLATAVPLTVGVFGSPAGVGAAIGITLVQAVHFGLGHGREGRPGSLTVQVRWLYLLALLLGLAPPLRALLVLALVGVWANIVFGYCLAARMLSLAPWNRRAPLSARLVASTFLSPPTTGSIAGRDARPPAPHTRVASRP